MFLAHYLHLLTSLGLVLSYIIAKLRNNSFYDASVLIQEDPFYRLIFYLVVCVFGISAIDLVIFFATGSYLGGNFGKALEDLRGIAFDVILTFFFAAGNQSADVWPIIPPLIVRFIVLCLRQTVASFQLMPTRPPLKRHQRLLFVQLCVLLFCFDRLLSWTKDFSSNDLSTAVILQFVHAIFDSVIDLIKHVIIIADGADLGNSQASFRVVKVTEFSVHVLDLAVNVISLIIILIKQKMPLPLCRPLYDNWRQLTTELRSWVDWKKMQEFIEKELPSATQEDLDRDDICIICRLSMNIQESKRLPCGHCLHNDCLERWIVQQTKCPICQANLSEYLEEAEKRRKEKDNEDNFNEFPKDQTISFHDLNSDEE